GHPLSLVAVALSFGVLIQPPHALARAAVSISAGAAVGLGLLIGLRLSWRLAALTAWDAGGLTLLVLAWLTIAMSSAERTRKRAGADDPGRTVVYLIVLLSSGASLLVTTALVRRARQSAGREGDALVALCLANVALCWAQIGRASCRERMVG